MMFARFMRIVLTMAILTMMTGISHACVGRILYIGALNNSIKEDVMSQLLVLLINERTGTNVKLRYFDTNDQLYAAFKSDEEDKRIDILVEDTIDGLAIINGKSTGDPEKDFVLVKKEYETKLNIIWLSPFGYKNSKGAASPSVSAPLVRRAVLSNFPLLPRVLNKLSGAISDTTFSDLVSKTKAGEKAKNVAKDFLRAKKFI